MKSSFQTQADEVNRLRSLVLNCDQSVLNDAANSLYSLGLHGGEKMILFSPDLKRIAQEFVMEVLEDDRELNVGEIRNYAESFKKVLNQMKS